MELDRLVIPPEATLLDALRKIDSTRHALALVVEHGRVIGTITDGDVRRALLAGNSLEAAASGVMTRAFTSVTPDADRTVVLDLMRARGVIHVPVLNDDGHLVGLHTLREMIGPVRRENWALIMAGGQGTRMGRITDEVPKPMLSVAGRPILERIVLQVVGSGIHRIFIAVNHLSDVVEGHFGNGERFGCTLEYVREEQPLGTAGALGLLPEAPVRPLLVLNGDLVTQADLGGLLDHHVASGADLTVGIRGHAIDIPYGVVEVLDGRIVSISEKPVVEMSVNAGIYALSATAVALVPTGQPISMVDLIGRCLEADLEVKPRAIEEEWIDVAYKEDLIRARGEM